MSYTEEEQAARPELNEWGLPVLLASNVRITRTAYIGLHGIIIEARDDGFYRVVIDGGPHLLFRRCDFEVLP